MTISLGMPETSDTIPHMVSVHHPLLPSFFVGADPPTNSCHKKLKYSFSLDHTQTLLSLLDIISAFYTLLTKLLRLSVCHTFSRIKRISLPWMRPSGTSSLALRRWWYRGGEWRRRASVVLRRAGRRRWANLRLRLTAMCVNLQPCVWRVWI